MTHINANFSFFKAGQGAFYGGQIRTTGINTKQWNIVYDCGASHADKGGTKSLNAEIDTFLFGIDKIDILFISHLDYDHVSGVFRLLKEIQVERVVIPYFPDGVRKISLISSGFAVNTSGVDLTTYIDFLSNPYDFLRNNNGNNTPQLFVVGSDVHGDNIQYEINNLEAEITYTSPTNQNRPSGLNQNDLYFRNNLQFNISKYWEFTTYAKDIDPTQFDKLKTCLNNLIGKSASDDITYNEIKKLFSDRSTRTLAKECYVKKLKDINAYGMTLFHSPVNFDFVDSNYYVDDELNAFSRYLYGNYFPFSKRTFNSMYYGILLMGDTSLDKNAVDFPPTFLDKIEYVHLFQVPHHGANDNWDLQAYNNLNLGNAIGVVPINVCNFGYGNKYGHPHFNVLYDLAGRIILNSQFLRFTTEYEVFYK